MTIALQLSCYNGSRYLPHVFAALARQTRQDWTLYMLDNASRDDEAAAIRMAVEQAPFPVNLSRVEKNIGFAGAHNMLFEKHKTTSDIVVLLNDDAMLEPAYVEEVVKTLEQHPECASVSGAVYRWRFEGKHGPLYGKTEVIDTLGIKEDLFGRVKDVAARKTIAWETLPTEGWEVAGVSGCLPAYRVKAVLEVSPWGTLFDPSFRIYKEDVDIARRFALFGWTARIAPLAIAYHRRTAGSSLLSLNRPMGESAYFSYRNHLWLLFTYEQGMRLLRLPFVLFMELAQTVYWLLRKPSIVIDAWRETREAWKTLMEKRAWIRKMRRVHTGGRRVREPEIPSADIAVVMVTHNDVSEECVRSLALAKQSSKRKIGIMVVDNHSKNADVHNVVTSIIPDAAVLLRNGDFGFGRSCNRGAKHIRAKYYFFLNPDTVVTDPTMFDRFVDELEKDATIGIIAPKIFYFDGRLQETCRRFPKWYMPFVQRSKLGETTWGKSYAAEFAMRDFDHASRKVVDWVQGSAFMISGDLLRIIGGFDERFWLYFEDMDLCRRVGVFGKSVVYEPALTLKHAHGKESAKYRNFFVNLVANEAARAHIISWFLYTMKWFRE